MTRIVARPSYLARCWWEICTAGRWFLFCLYGAKDVSSAGAERVMVAETIQQWLARK